MIKIKDIITQVSCFCMLGRALLKGANLSYRFLLHAFALNKLSERSH